MELPAFLRRHKYGEIHVIERYNQGETAAAIAEYFPSVPQELIEKTIAFYEANRAEVDAYISAYVAEIERQEAEPRHGPDLAELRRRLQAQDPKSAK
jgi:uncharacterized protein (DUF433 family)